MVQNSVLSAYAQDDFVRTISDDDDLPNFDVDEVSDGKAGIANDRKRKRAPFPTLQEPKHAKKPKKLVEDDEDDSDVEKGFDDGTFDRNFEFSLSKGDSIDTTFDIDTNDTLDGLENGPLDIDRIIKRRRLQDVTDKRPSHDAAPDPLGPMSDEDELLAQDGFGMGTATETILENGDWQDVPDEDGDTSSESEESVAAPVPHPDDEGSGAESEKEDVDQAEAGRRAAFFEPELESQSLQAKGVKFSDMSLSRPILKGLTSAGFSSPTPIQAKTVPMALLGKDVVGGAVTGSGKTAAFIIPILERLLYRPKKIPVTRVVVLIPTRELAVQCHQVAMKLASFSDISFALIVGGLSLREQEQTLKTRPDVVIATPGRFIDHMRNSAAFSVEHVEILVLDEADRMLEDGFADELNEVLNTLPRSRQTMLFSATMTENLDQLIRAGLKRPVRLLVDSKKQTVQALVQEFVRVKPMGKSDDLENLRLAYLLYLCTHVYIDHTIIFFPRKFLAHRTKILFALHHIKSAELHGSMSQDQRLKAINAFRSGHCTHLLATDLASRGLDIPRVETVVNFNVPTSVTTYLHRVGRTARAGRTGVACTLFSAAKEDGSKQSKRLNTDRSLLRPILKLAKKQSADIRTRSLPSSSLNALLEKILSQQPEIESILAEEKEEKLIAQGERDVIKGENLIKYQDEIASRPKRTWFQSEKDKMTSSKLGKEDRLGTKPMVNTRLAKPKKKLSGKEKKQLQNKDERSQNTKHGWKKGREERAGRGVLMPNKAHKGKDKKGKTGPARLSKRR